MRDVELILKLCDELQRNDVLVIVEGLRDERALRLLGFNRILRLTKALYQVIEEAAKESKVAILTDLDSEGKKLFHEFSVHLQRHGVKIDNRLRKALFKTPVRHIEGLASFLGKIQR